MSLESNFNDPIDKSAVDLLKTIRDLQQQVMEQKMCAQRKVAEAASTNDYFELHTLRGWMADQEKTVNQTDDLEKPNIVQLSEEYVLRVKGQVNMIADAS
ncbi:hypothetical protein CASFOL_033746 [Castilleja foliolosa]|uniref:Uncharacterized protein n=1 Tax=Castilleja foliolosa TaxID=1961234 RepID=A0ABD3BXU4_9LAMI